MSETMEQAIERIALHYFGMKPGMPDWFAYNSAWREAMSFERERIMEKVKALLKTGPTNAADTSYNIALSRVLAAIEGED